MNYRERKRIILAGIICPAHGIPAITCGAVHEGPCPWFGGHYMPSIYSEMIRHEEPTDPLPPNPYIGSKDSIPVYDQSAGNYGSMIRRTSTGADAGGEADPLVQEPNQ